MAETERTTDEAIEKRAKMARALAQGGMEDALVISRETATSVLTPRRRELVEELDQGDYPSVRALARHLGRDKAAVSRDLATLAEENLVTYEQSGRAKKPVLAHEHVVVEPVV